MDLIPKQDKLTHFFVGGIICLIYFPLLLLHINPIIGLYIAFGLAAGKEIYDKVSKKGTPEVLDFLYTFFMPLTTYLLIWLS